MSSSVAIARGFVRSWKDLANHLRWNIRERNVDSLRKWFEQGNAPMYLPRDLPKMEKIIYGSVINTTYHPVRPTILNPTYRYILNPSSAKLVFSLLASECKIPDSL